jgi:hypothetical protein
VALLPSGKVIVPPDAPLIVCEMVAIVPDTMTDAEADLVGSSVLVALTVTVYGVGTAAGAV